MIILKMGIAAVYFIEVWSVKPEVVREFPEPETAAMAVLAEPAAPGPISLTASANAADAAAPGSTDESSEPVVDDAVTLEQMAAEKERLLAREEYLERQEARLQALKEEITRKIEELTLLREEILATMDLKNEAQEAEVKHLIKIYSTMKPQKVAQLIEQLDIDLVTALFSQMKGDVVGDILSFVDSETGARITRGLFPDPPADTGKP
jgi:flagellar motility protein MotE (MotC chaperone)